MDGNDKGQVSRGRLTLRGRRVGVHQGGTSQPEIIDLTKDRKMRQQKITECFKVVKKRKASPDADVIVSKQPKMITNDGWMDVIKLDDEGDSHFVEVGANEADNDGKLNVMEKVMEQNDNLKEDNKMDTADDDNEHGDDCITKKFVQLIVD